MLEKTSERLSYHDFRAEVLSDYRLCVESRETSLKGRKEVLTGKAKFGIFGDGKELAQIALAKCYQEGDFRSGYYRDQTWMLASGVCTLEQFFAQLYAHADIAFDPASGGRQMNAHFATRSLDERGEWLPLNSMKNSAADASPTASQMPRSLGLAMASKVYRHSQVEGSHLFSDNGNEICFASIGDASTAEGLFWETINAAGVVQVPLAISIWDDGYGISVPREYQLAKEDISELLSGFRSDEGNRGIDLYTVRGWDYSELCMVYSKGVNKIRETHRPAVFHITEVTQPQGHSTSGSHERYKSHDRLEWEREYDCNAQFRKWILENKIAAEEELLEIEQDAKSRVNDAKVTAWKEYQQSIKAELASAVHLLEALGKAYTPIAKSLTDLTEPFRRDIHTALHRAAFLHRNEPGKEITDLQNYLKQLREEATKKYNTHLYSETEKSALRVVKVSPVYAENAPVVNGYEVLNQYFDKVLATDNRVLAFGEDVGKIGDVNQGFAGLQEKFGEARIFDTGIREATIVGQAIGLAMRGLRPIAEIQYLDYLIYGLEPLSDDLATLRYRTAGGQKAPVIIRTRGHRLEGIWHTGSPIGMIIHSLRGMYVCVPRNMTEAAGMYQTLLLSDEPGLVIECLNGYRLKEKLPSNLGEYTIPLGIPEVIRQGSDCTIVSYGSTLRICEQAANTLAEAGIQCELIDVRTLLPFDLPHIIEKSVQKTGRIIFIDEDVPGGASAYMLERTLSEQDIFRWLDAKPETLSAKPHRSPYGSDGDYFSKPSTEEIVDKVYGIMNEADPDAYPVFL